MSGRVQAGNAAHSSLTRRLRKNEPRMSQSSPVGQVLTKSGRTPGPRPETDARRHCHNDPFLVKGRSHPPAPSAAWPPISRGRRTCLLAEGCHYGRPAWIKLYRRWMAGFKFEQVVHCTASRRARARSRIASRRASGIQRLKLPKRGAIS